MPSLLGRLARLSRAAAALASSVLAPSQPRPLIPPRPVEPPSAVTPTSAVSAAPASAASPPQPAPAYRPPPSAPPPSSTSSPPGNKPVHKPVASTSIKLRPYQVDCVRAVLDEVQRGDSTRLGVSAPTGSGKTAMFTTLISHLPPLVHPVTREVATQVLVLVSSIQLVEQTANAIQRAYPHLSVEVEQGDSRSSGYADVTVCTYQTLARSSYKRLEKFVPDRFKAVIVDEAHHAAAKSYLDILARFDSHIEHALAAKSSGPSVPHVAARVVARAPEGKGDNTPTAVGSGEGEQVTGAVPPASAGSPTSTSADAQLPVLAPVAAKLDSLGRIRVPLLAFTATWARSDGLALGKVVEKIVWHCDWLDLMRGKWLSEVSFTTVHLDEAVDLSQVAVSAKTGDFTSASLSRALNTDATNELVLKAYLENAADRRSTLIFAASVPHVVSLSTTFRSRGIDARIVHAGTPTSQREALYRSFRAGKFPVLVNCGILTEGADFPAIDCVVVARPTRSKTLFLQMIGRGLRLSPDTGKRDCLIIDVVSNCVNVGIVCTPTLLGLDPADVAQGRSSRPFDTFVTSHEQHAPEPARRNKVDLSSVSYEHLSAEGLLEYLKAQGKETNAERLRASPFAWVECGGDTWILPLQDRGRLEIVRENGTFRVSFHERYTGTDSRSSTASAAFADLDRDQTSTLLATPDSFLHALLAADTVLYSHPHLVDLAPLLERTHPWRQRPARESTRSLALQMVANSTQPNGTGTDTGSSTHVFDGDGGDEPWWAHVAFSEQFTEGDASDLVATWPRGGLALLERQRKASVGRAHAGPAAAQEERPRDEGGI
ncbi:hypothetical protein JCM8208_004642 [Rhodotorula glutinis]